MFSEKYIIMLVVKQFSLSPAPLSPIYVQIFLYAPCYRTPPFRVLIFVRENQFYNHLQHQVKLQVFLFVYTTTHCSL